MKSDILDILEFWASKSIYKPNLNSLEGDDWSYIMSEIELDFARYYEVEFDIEKIKYYPGLLATFFYRISRCLYMKGSNLDAQEFSSLGLFLSGMEIYYSASIGLSLKINHGIGTIIGARAIIGNSVLIHHNVTIGDKNGGRPTIGNNVIIYPGTVIVGNIEIGDNSIIGANSFVDKNVPANSKIF